MIQHIKKNIQERVYNESCLNITGPVALCNCFKEFFSCQMIDKGTQGIQIFQKEFVESRAIEDYRGLQDRSQTEQLSKAISYSYLGIEYFTPIEGYCIA
jgi:hypothetical protein